MRLRDLEGKNVVIWGAGRECRSVISACLRSSIECNFSIIDEDSNGPVDVDGIPVFRTGIDAIVAEADVIVRSPGISKYRSELEQAYREQRVTSATKLWFAEEHSRVIGVTGTKGKSTTSALISHLLSAVGMSTRLAGNIGASPLDYIGSEEPDCWVLELSSFQASDLDVSPEIGILTTLSPEHLDWHGTAEQYVADKLNLFAHGCSTVLANASDEGIRQVIGRLEESAPVVQWHQKTGPVRIENGYFFFESKRLFPIESLRLSGIHNQRLACIALTALNIAGVDLSVESEKLESALNSFEALPHRLAPVGEHSGVLYVNDSLATNPLATIAALEAFQDRPTVVILGGHDRGVDYSDLAAYVVANCERVKVVTLPANGPRIASEITAISQSTRSPSVEIHHAEGLPQAVSIAARISEEGGVVALSPAAASFGEFANYAARGDAFALEVARLQN